MCSMCKGLKNFSEGLTSEAAAEVSSSCDHISAASAANATVHTKME